VARALQSAEAEALLQELRAKSGPEGPSSKAHSRALVAAAAAPRGRIGIDVEFHAPGRRIRDVARWLMGADARDDGAAYRVFTFYEAYFKAVGVFPSAAAMRAIAGNVEGRCKVDEFDVLHRIAERDFTLTLVWSA
jgi:hypothetical protein